MRPVSCLVLFLILCSCGPAQTGDDGPVVDPETDPQPLPQPAPAPPTDYTFAVGESFGRVAYADGLDELAAAYGEDFAPTTIDGPEGTTYEGYALFPGTPREVFVTYLPARRLAFDVRRSDSPWTGYGGRFRAGMTLDELTALNGQPVTFSGLGWDYGGYVLDWNGGALDDLTVRLDYDGSAAAESIMGDAEFSSADVAPELRSQVRVSSFVVRM